MACKNKYKWIQPVRMAVQALIMLGCILALFTSKTISSWLLPSVLLLGVFSCGWVCPLGTVQEWAYKLGRLLRLPLLRMPEGVQRYLQLSRYIMLFLVTVYATVEVIKGFFSHLHATKFLGSLMKGNMLETSALVILLSFIIIGLFFNRPFCNYFCTGGARAGLWSVLRIVGIRRNTTNCCNCKLCNKACPMNINVADTRFVRHPNCIGCMSCLAACPKNCLSYTIMPGSQKPDKKQS